MSYFIGAICTAIFFITSVTANAATVALDFEHLEISGNTSYGAGFTFEDGYRINVPTAGALEIYGTEHSFYSGSTTVFTQYQDDLIQISRIDGGSFSLVSLDLGEFPTGSFQQEIIVSAIVPGVGGVTKVKALDGILGLETFDFSSFNNVNEISITGNGLDLNPEYPFQLDNVVLLEVAVVPIPAAVWFFGSGLLGLIGFAKRKAI